MMRLLGVASPCPGEKLRGADPIDGRRLDKGGVEGFEVERAMDIHPSASSRGLDHLVQGVIPLANAALKMKMERPKAAKRLLELARTHIGKAFVGCGGEALIHQHVTHNRHDPTQKQFANAILGFLRETIPNEWKTFPSQVEAK